MSDETGLRELQRWMLTVLTDPGGVGAGERAAQEAAILRTRDRVTDRFTASKELAPHQRLGVYAHMYFERLLESLEMDHRGLRHAMGEDEFRKVARQFAVDRPSTYFTLNRFGETLPAYLESRGRFLFELATLERSIIEVFHEEACDPLQAETLQSIPQEQWGALPLNLVPATRLFRFEHPVSAYLDDVNADRSPAWPEASATMVLVHRTHYSVHRHQLAEEPFAVLEALAAGLTLQDGLVKVLEATTRPPEELLSEVGSWFQEWMSWGLFAALEDGS